MRNLLTRRSSGGRARARLNGSRVAVVLAGVLVAFVAVLGVTSVAWAALSEHTVTGVSPRGTTINLFDYWVTGQADHDNVDYTEDQGDQGINAGHTLKFGKGMGESEDPYTADAANVNDWTKSAHPRTGIVANNLGSGDYPVLSDTLGGQSLSYLFDASSFDGKDAYMDVDGLLQVDGEGYYYYNSQKNFAQFNKSTNDFTLYDAWGVKHEGSSPDGQFFPFNTGDEVLDGTSGITQKDVTSLSDGINHYFGLNMSTRFVQQNGGHTDESRATDVTYNFSGDDDVWIFIDGVLVGDLGGIHNKTSIEINFADGHVYVYDDANNNNECDAGETRYQDTSLLELFRNAGKAATTRWSGYTFVDGTYHTLDFFYLERGNTDSNMSLKYNLVNIPESDVVKVDQSGDPLPGISFTLRQAKDDTYQIVPDGMTVSGTTNGNGQFVFIDPSSSDKETPITLEQLQERGGNYWVLTEENVPDGYRSAGEMHLRFEDGFLLSSNEWDTGAWAEPHVTAVASTRVVAKDSRAEYDPGNGVAFAVVFQKDEGGSLHPVSGDDESGWNVASGTDNAAIVAAAKANNYQFLLGSGGGYEVTIENLPGDILTYEYVVNKNHGSQDDFKYAVRYYYVDGADSLQDVTASSTLIELDPNASGRDFDRIFSVTLNVPNVKNELTLHKTNADGTENLAGAVYTLYGDANGNGQVDADEQPVAEGLTTDQNGMVEIYSSVDEKLLANGNYVLVETGAPTDYVLDATPIQIVVDDDGVHVNAGTADDNVTVETGIGDLVYSMRSFAADDQVDATLHEVKALPQTATAYEGESTTWDKAGEELHFQYQDEDDGANKYTYLPSNSGAATHTADVGWSRLNVTQCMSDMHGDANNTDYKEPLGEDQSLNGLFTGDVTIHVTNRKLSSLTVEKTVAGKGAPAGATFEFTLKFADANGPISGTFEAKTTPADGSSPTTQQLTFSADTTENSFTLENGDRITINGLPAGTTYTVTEAAADYYDQSVSPDANSSKTEDGLASTGTITSDPVAVEFTNTFWGGSVDYDQATGVDISKTFTGRDMKPGETFTINVQPNDAASAALLGLKDEKDVLPIEFSGLGDGVKVTNDLTAGKSIVFTEGNVGTYSYTVSEVRPADDPIDGVTYDDTVYTLTIEATVDSDGVVTVTTSATDGDGFDEESTVSGFRHTNSAIELSFANTYAVAPDDGGDQGGTTPDDPKDAIPRTGDDSFAHAPALALLGAAVVAGGVVLRRRLTRE